MLDDAKKLLPLCFLLGGSFFVFSADIADDSISEAHIPVSSSLLSDKDQHKVRAFTDYAEFLNTLFLRRNAQDLNAAQRKLFDAVEQDPESPFLLNLIRGAVFSKQDSVIRKLKTDRLEAFLKKNPNYLDIASICAQNRTLLKEYEAAAALLKPAVFAALRKNHEGPIPWKLMNAALFLADLYAENGHLDETEDVLDRLNDVPMNGLQKNQYLLSASDLYRKLESKVSDNRPFFTGLWRGSEKSRCRRQWLAYKKRFTEEALPNAEKESPESFFRHIAARHQKSDSVLPDQFADLMLEDPDKPWGREALAYYYLEHGDFAESARLWKQILSDEKKKDNPYLLFIYAECLRRSGNEEKAAPVYEELLKQTPDRQEYILPLAYCLFDSGKERSALFWINKLKKNQESVLLLRYLIYDRMKEYSKAMDVLMQMYELNLSEQRIFRRDFAIQGAFLAEKLKRYDRMRLFLEPILAQNPDDVEVLNLLGYSLADGNVNLDLADRLLTRAQKLNPDNPAILDSMAWLRYRQKRDTEALNLIRMAIEKTPPGEYPDPVILDHAGDIYIRNGKVSEALNFWEKALRTESTEVNPDVIRQKIQRYGSERKKK